VTAFDLGDAAIKQAVAAAASRVILIAEGAKFALRTDSSAPPAVLDRLRAAGVEVSVV
jgi:DeoR/GlpR family transcriptional regulator of sugar metabolism